MNDSRKDSNVDPSTIDSVGNSDPELRRIVGEEENCLSRVIEHIEGRRNTPAEKPLTASDYDAQLLLLRDELSSARLEDVPPLLEQMERLQMLADQRRKEQSQGSVDLRSPYFGRMVLEENERRREVLIGRETYLDTKAGIRIVDWRDAPVSRLYYRYQEGDDYNEIFGDKEIDGEVLTRRSLSIVEGSLRRIGSPQGSYARMATGGWRKLDVSSSQLRGGECSATRPEKGRGGLGIGDNALSDDKSLKEITALIDPRQFDLITRGDSGLVVIQGGAGSGKTTIGLHRLAYLAYNDSRRFRPDRMLVVVFNRALCRYIAQVLPSLGVEGVAIRTYGDWAARLRTTHLMGLPSDYSTDTPAAVTRFKKHPALLQLIDSYVASLGEQFGSELAAAWERAGSPSAAGDLVEQWNRGKNRPLRHRAHALLSLARDYATRDGGQSDSVGIDLRVAIERIAGEADTKGRDVVVAWSELLTDKPRIEETFGRLAPGEFSRSDFARIHDWCTLYCSKVFAENEARRDGERVPTEKTDREDRTDDGERNERRERRERRSERPARDDVRASRDEDGGDDDDRRHGIDGVAVDDQSVLDREDDTLLLLLHQKLRGPLLRGSKAREALIYEHVLVDEAQDYSPVELAVLLNTVSSGRSVTLAGDTAQRVLLDNGFSDWDTVLSELGLSHVEIEPLRLSYRSTQEIIDLSLSVLGPLAPEHPGTAVRHGAPVELFRFAHSGDAAGFLAEQLRILMANEPRASVAVIARFPEQADAFYDVLDKGEVPRLRRIADQDFPFKPGVDVTDIKQVKGLEFDYVVLVEVNTDTYPEVNEARHLLHIGATRASHQLWVLSTSEPSKLLPEELRARAL